MVLPTQAQDKTPISKDSLEVLLQTCRDYYYSHNYAKTIEVGTVLIEEATYAKNHYYAFRGYTELGHMYSWVLKDSVKGSYNGNKALEHALLSKEDSLIAWAYSSIGNKFGETGGTNAEKAIGYYKKAIDIRKKKEGGDIKNIIEYMNIGWVYVDLNKPDKAYPYLKKTKELTKIEEQSPLLLLNLDIQFARYHLLRNEYQKAILLLTEVANTAKEKDYIIQGSESNMYLAQAYEAAGYFKQANAALKEERLYKDRIFASGQQAAIEEASAKLALKNYQKDVVRAEQEKNLSEALAEKSKDLNIIMVVVSVALLIAFVIIFMLSKARKRNIIKLRETNVELTTAKEEAEKLSRLKTQFFSTVSHELRTPLYGVIGLSSLLLEDKKLKSHQNDLESLKFSADYLLALINDVLTLNKMDANGLALVSTPFQLTTLLNNIVRSFAFSLQQHNNQLHLTVDERLPNQFLGDSVRLSQILMNLVGNAVKFNENGNIWLSINLISAHEDGSHTIEFVVKDDGIGVPKEKQEEIFNEFSQVENKNYNYQGTGLGLPIVMKLLQLFDSKVHLESDLGEGATFSFQLKLNELKTEQIQELSEITTEDLISEEHLFENLHVLVVDDNKINQKITQKILESKHFTCSLANDGVEAVEKVKDNEYDLILMDIHMPNMNGIEATEAIRVFNKNIPIVALTAVEVDEIRKQIIGCGMNDIILKPYDVSQFTNTILRNLSMLPNLSKTV